MAGPLPVQIAGPPQPADRWRSPVLFVHSDDDRDVPFAQTVDLINALRTQGHVQIDQLVIANEIPDLIPGKSWETFFDAADRFFDAHLRANGAGRQSGYHSALECRSAPLRLELQMCPSDLAFASAAGR